ncbi:hypothetical protein sscle_05g043230 [Sclerotinia sclerotiorum 1980 UF-70]|uniref:Uncharacterized protein n=1 Tax=Sclerotinia sclerotiorum (strain ATCC 18683 / 1980 / Ss-1) TaxID=665079 RepID=A0A1D9Q4R2_SCLS1|nr:hypothetical protein sscle_05g043230 [Sclerotinia sclerotiorum 1980 UF-70]
MARVFCISGNSTQIREEAHPGGFRRNIPVTAGGEPGTLKFKGKIDSGFRSRNALGAL